MAAPTPSVRFDIDLPAGLSDDALTELANALLIAVEITFEDHGHSGGAVAAFILVNADGDIRGVYLPASRDGAPVAG